MSNFTDLVIVLFLLYFMYSGWNRGILRTLSGPLAFVICILLAFIYFQHTHNLIYALLISLLGPLVLKWLFSFIFSFLDKLRSDDEKPSILSRVLGLLLNLTWSGGLFILTLFFLALLPFDFKGLEPIRQNIQASYSFYWMAKQIPALKKWKPAVHKDLSGLNEEPAIERTGADLRDSPDFKDIMQDPRVQELLADESIKNDIQTKNVLSLLNNPKFVKILNDPELVQKFIGVYLKAQESQVIAKEKVEIPAEQVSPVPESVSDQPFKPEEIYKSR